jgi:uncharacterized protein YchJ
MKNKNVYLYRGCLLLAVLALAACGAVRKDDATVVEARALERWNFLIAHQAEKAYDYLTPGFRQTITRQKYADDKNDVALRWKSARVIGHKCDADACTVTVMIDAQVKMPGVGRPQAASLPTDERWVKLNGTWYYLPDTRLKATPVAPEAAPPGKDPDTGKQPD